MKAVPYASMVSGLMYAMLCTRPYICFVVAMMSRYQSNLGMKHWMAIKHILKHFQRTRDYMLVYHCDDLLPLGYTNSDFQRTRDYMLVMHDSKNTLQAWSAGVSLR